MNQICANCGSIGKPVSFAKGSFVMEILLWLMLIVPGVLYSLWRLTTKAKVCGTCRSPNMVPLYSPKGIQLHQDFHRPRA